jgi:hypothetical protein
VTYNLVNYTNTDGLEIAIDTNTGKAYASQNAVARMCVISKQAISKYLTVNQTPTFSAKILTTTGLKTVNLLDEEGIARCIIKYNPELAFKFQKLGIRVGLHEMAGYKVTTTATEQKPMTQLQMIAMMATEAQTIADNLAKLDSRVAVIEQRAVAAEAKMKELPPGKGTVPERTTRVNLNTLIRSYAKANGMDYAELWHNLYREFRDRHHVDLSIRAKNAGATVLDYAEAKGSLEDLYTLATEMYLLELPNVFV